MAPLTNFAAVATAVLLLLGSRAHAFEFTFYTGKQCNSAGQGYSIFGPEAGCQGPNNPNYIANFRNAQSMVVGNTGAVDDAFWVVLFSSTDCNPETIVAQGDSGCLATPSGGFKSMQVWDLCDGKGAKCLDE